MNAERDIEALAHSILGGTPRDFPHIGWEEALQLLAAEVARLTAERERLVVALNHADGLIAVWAVSDRDAGTTLNEIAEVLRPVLAALAPQAEARGYCGHPLSAVVSSDEGTSYCGVCAETPEERER